MWTDAYIGISYAPLGRGPDHYDCLGLWLELMRVRQGIVLEDPRVSMLQAVRQKTAEMYKPQFRAVLDVREGDALLFNHNGRALHVAYAVDQENMLHVSDATCGSTLERWRGGLIWQPLLVGIYRYAA